MFVNMAWQNLKIVPTCTGLKDRLLMEEACMDHTRIRPKKERVHMVYKEAGDCIPYPSVRSCRYCKFVHAP